VDLSPRIEAAQEGGRQGEKDNTQILGMMTLEGMILGISVREDIWRRGEEEGRGLLVLMAVEVREGVGVGVGVGVAAQKVM